MAMVSVVNWRLMVQADLLGPKVGSHLVLCCNHHMNRVISGSVSSLMTAPYSGIVIVVISCRSTVQDHLVAPVSKREMCRKELLDTEKNYIDVLRLIIDVSPTSLSFTHL